MRDRTALPSPLRGRYLVHNRSWNALLRAADAMLSAVVRNPPQPSAREPRRVLLAIGGHLGDALIATNAIARVHHLLPSAEIGVVLGSWARPALDGHPHVRWIHTVDHWKSNRAPLSFAAKLRRFRASWRQALGEIRATGYDAAVDLYMYYPNMAGLLWRAGIPIRVGFTSGGYGPLYTHPVEWSDADEHTSEQHARLLRVLFPSLNGAGASSYELPPITESARRRAESVMRESGLEPGAYTVVHMGPGSAVREWPIEKWRELAQRLVADGRQLAFTGSGVEQMRHASEAARGLERCVNLTNALGWPEFVHVVASAQALICVETVAAHVAAAVGTPCVAIWSGIGRLSHWRPHSSQSTVLMSPVPCAPCFRGRGCGVMSCVRDVSVDAVLDAVQAHLVRSREEAETGPVG